MTNQFILKILVAASILLFSLPCFAGDVVYYDSDGNVITKAEHEKISQEKQLEKQKAVQKSIEELKSQTDASGRPLYDDQGRRIVYKVIYNHEDLPGGKIRYDRYGRPLYDSKGRRITYVYDVLWKKCLKCRKYVPLKLRHGDPCPHCGTPWYWPEITKIKDGGIEEFIGKKKK